MSSLRSIGSKQKHERGQVKGLCLLGRSSHSRRRLSALLALPLSSRPQPHSSTSPSLSHLCQSTHRLLASVQSSLKHNRGPITRQATPWRTHSHCHDIDEVSSQSCAALASCNLSRMRSSYLSEPGYTCRSQQGATRVLRAPSRCEPSCRLLQVQARRATCSRLTHPLISRLASTASNRRPSLLLQRRPDVNMYVV